MSLHIYFVSLRVTVHLLCVKNMSLLHESSCKISNSACNSSPSPYNKYEAACVEHRSVCKTALNYERSIVTRCIIRL